MTPSSSTTGLNGCSLTTTTSPPWSEHRLVPWCRCCGGVVSNSDLRNCLMSSSGTCWNTRRAWGSGWQPIPKTSLLYTAKEGKVKSKNLIFFFYDYLPIAVAFCAFPIRTHRHHDLHLAYWQWPVWECPGTGLPGFLIISSNKLTISKWFPLVHQDSLEYFGERRTDKSRSSKFQGVETPSQVRTDQNVPICVDQTGVNVCKSQSRYVRYYEIMKNTFNRQLPPPIKLGIKSIRIHSIAGNSQKTRRFSKPLLCLMRLSFSAVT